MQHTSAKMYQDYYLLFFIIVLIIAILFRNLPNLLLLHQTPTISWLSEKFISFSEIVGKAKILLLVPKHGFLPFAKNKWNQKLVEFERSCTVANRRRHTANVKMSCKHMNVANLKSHQYKKNKSNRQMVQTKSAAITENGIRNLHATKQMQTKNAATTNKMLQPQEIGPWGKTLQLVKPTANMKCCKLPLQIGSTLDYKGLPGTQRKCW